MEDLEFSMTFIFHKMFKRTNLAFSIHTAAANKPKLREEVGKLVSSLENTYKRRLA